MDAVIALSVETWDDMVSRQFARPPDRMTAHLLRTDRVDKTLVVHPWRNAAAQVRRRIGPGRDAPFPRTAEHHLVRPIRLRRQEPASADQLERSYRLYSRWVGATVKRHALTEPLLITFNPLFAAFGDHRGFRSVTYVARDDWASYPPHQRLWPMYDEAYERIRQRQIRVSAVSDVLLQRIAPTGPKLVVPNGVDPETWGADRERPASLTGLRGPIAIYTGTVDSRLSLPALKIISSTLGDGTIVLVGPQHGDMATRIRAEIPNAVLLAPVGQAALAALVRNADVCVIPHVRSPLTEAMSPLKLYEYLAAGRPVVATDLPPMHGVHDSVILIADDARFGEGVTRALERGPLPEGDRVRFIETNSWESRCRQILTLAST